MVSLFNCCFVFGQGSFQYDQQATNLIEGAAPWALQPMGQSFTPSIASVGFVELYLFHSDSVNHLGSSLSVMLRANSINGVILDVTSVVFIPDGFLGLATFTFPGPVNVVPGEMYFLQFVQSGDNVSSYVADGSYSGGSEILQGIAIPDRNVWFREGVVVPEPSSAILVVFGLGALIMRWRVVTKDDPRECHEMLVDVGCTLGHVSRQTVNPQRLMKIAAKT